MVAAREIQDLGDHMAARFGPHQVILSGSYAHGPPGPESDVDLLAMFWTGITFSVGLMVMTHVGCWRTSARKLPRSESIRCDGC